MPKLQRVKKVVAEAKPAELVKLKGAASITCKIEHLALALCEKHASTVNQTYKMRQETGTTDAGVCCDFAYCDCQVTALWVVLDAVVSTRSWVLSRAKFGE
jgi:hypothetical protein